MGDGGGGRGGGRGKADLQMRRWRLTGSNTPAPGHTIFISPNSFTASSKAACNWFQSMTSVFLNTALAFPPATGLPLITSSASGRRAKSATRTLHPCERSSFVNSRQIPLPPPVTSAVFPETRSAILVRDEIGRG